MAKDIPFPKQHTNPIAPAGDWVVRNRRTLIVASTVTILVNLLGVDIDKLSSTLDLKDYKLTVEIGLTIVTSYLLINYLWNMKRFDIHARFEEAAQRYQSQRELLENLPTSSIASQAKDAVLSDKIIESCIEMDEASSEGSKYKWIKIVMDVGFPCLYAGVAIIGSIIVTVRKLVA